ncbi:MAG: hypothetical protein ABI528_10415 [bacterium]
MDEIKIDASKITLEGSKAEKMDFCAVWPATRQGLDYLRSIVSNPIVKLIVGVIISAGNAICPE